MDPQIPQRVPPKGEARPEPFDRRLEENVALLRRYVRAKAGPAVRAREPVSDIVQSIVREACETPLREHEDDGAFRSWLCTIAANKIVSKNRFYSAERRDAARERPLSEHGRTPPAAEDERSPEIRAEREEDLDRLRRALDSLDPLDREIVVLRKLLDVPAAEVAERVELSISTVRSRLARAMTELAARLAQGR
jgi:RNA polymerase sigma-70 factor (ECF subfamily)